MIFNPKYTITDGINKALVEIERVRGFLDAVKLKDEWFADMQKEALIIESHHSATSRTYRYVKSRRKGNHRLVRPPEAGKPKENYTDFTDA